MTEHQEREHAVPCQHVGCQRLTWRVDARCERHLDAHRGTLHSRMFADGVDLTCSCGQRLPLGDDPTPERAMSVMQQHRAVMGAVA